MEKKKKTEKCEMVFYAKSLCDRDDSVFEEVEIDVQDFIQRFNLIQSGDGSLVYVQRFFEETKSEA